jgi:hypothetical protein
LQRRYYEQRHKDSSSRATFTKSILENCNLYLIQKIIIIIIIIRMRRRRRKRTPCDSNAVSVNNKSEKAKEKD